MPRPFLYTTVPAKYGLCECVYCVWHGERWGTGMSLAACKYSQTCRGREGVGECGSEYMTLHT